MAAAAALAGRVIPRDPADLRVTVVTFNVGNEEPFAPGTQHADEPIALSDARLHSEVVFTALYIVEVVVKLSGYGVKGLMADSQDVIAVFCAFASVLDSALFLSESSCGEDAGATSMLRLFRALRLLRLLRLAGRAPGLELFCQAALVALEKALRAF